MGGLSRWQESCCMHSGVREAYERHLDNLGIRGEGLAVGVVTEVGFTEEPWAAFSSAGCEGHALQYWGRRGRKRKHVTPETLPFWGWGGGKKKKKWIPFKYLSGNCNEPETTGAVFFLYVSQIYGSKPCKNSQEVFNRIIFFKSPYFTFTSTI